MAQAATALQLSFEETVIESYNLYEMATKGVTRRVMRSICVWSLYGHRSFVFALRFDLFSDLSFQWFTLFF